MKRVLFAIAILFLTSIVFVACTPETDENEFEQIKHEINPDKVKVPPRG